MDHSIMNPDGTRLANPTDGIPTCAELRTRFPRLAPFLPLHNVEWSEHEDRIHYLVSGFHDIQRSLAEILKDAAYNDNFNRETLYGLSYAMQTHCEALGDLVYVLMCRRHERLVESHNEPSAETPVPETNDMPELPPEQPVA